MTVGSPSRVAVIGAGIAGLVAARQLQRQGHEVAVFEASSGIAGMAASHTDSDGFSYDLGAHFVTNRLAAAVGCGDWRVVRRYGEVVYLNGRYVRYPGGLMRQPRFVAAALKAKLGRDDEPAGNAAAWFRHAYGAALADEVALPLVEAWSGRSADQLSAAVGEKLPGSIAGSALLRMAARLTRRAVAVGYCRERPQSPAVFHVYPRGGVAQLCETLAAQLDGRIFLNRPVQRITVTNGVVRELRVADTDIPIDAVVSTMPINRLATIVEGTSNLERFRRFEYRPIRALNVKLKGRGLLPDTLTWTPKGFSFFRLSEATWSMPWLAPEGATMVLVELNASPGDADWDLDPDLLIERVLGELTRLIPDVRSRVLGVDAQYLPLAYPIFSLDYEADRRDLEEHGTGIDKLLSIGRNGEFAHILMEDSYWRTVDAMSALGTSLRRGAGVR